MNIVPKPNILLAGVIEWEVSHRIDVDTWTQAASPNTNCWYIVHNEGKPSKVEEDGQEYVEEDFLADPHCNANPSTWFWDSSNNRLYVHTSGGGNPHGTYILLSYFWELFGTHSPIILNGKEYLAYLEENSIPSVVLATSGYHEGGTKSSFGTIKFINSDGYFDARLSLYIHEAKRMRALSAECSIVDGVFTHPVYALWDCIWEGWSGNIKWSDEYVEVETEDLRSMMI